MPVATLVGIDQGSTAIPGAMKAAVYHGVNDVRLEDVPAESAVRT